MAARLPALRANNNNNNNKIKSNPRPWVEKDSLSQMLLLDRSQLLWLPVSHNVLVFPIAVFQERNSAVGYGLLCSKIVSFDR
jgi:hypothetical protein